MTVLSRDPDRIYTYGDHVVQRPVWRVGCECGREYSIDQTQLLKSKKQMCRACRSKLRMSPPEDLSGRQFGSITVLGMSGEWIGSRTLWRVRCDRCGKEYVLDRYHLQQNTTCSCVASKNLSAGMQVMRSLDVAGTNLAAISPNRKLNKNSTTGVRGVCPLGDKYRATITFQRKQYHLGTFSTLQDAIHARKTAEKEVFGNFIEWYESQKNTSSSKPD